LRILLIVHHSLDASSGAAGSVMALAHEYRAAGHVVEVMGTEGLRWVPARFRGLLFPAHVALRARLGRAWDVIDASTGDAWLWAVTLGRARTALLVTRSHGLEHLADHALRSDASEGLARLSRIYHLYRGGLHLWEVKKSLLVADACLFLNRRERQYAVTELGVSEAVAHVVPNGLPAELLGLAPPEHSVPSRFVGLGSFGLSRKGSAYLVAAARELLEAMPDSTLLLAGVGIPTDAVLANFPTALRARIRVVERYTRTELPSLLRGHHVLLFTSTMEGFGNVVLEAMACGVVPVAFDIAGPDEIIVNGATGILVPPRSVPKLVRSVLELLEGDALDEIRCAAHGAAQSWGWASSASSRLAAYRTHMHGAHRRGLGLPTSYRLLERYGHLSTRVLGRPVGKWHMWIWLGSLRRRLGLRTSVVFPLAHGELACDLTDTRCLTALAEANADHPESFIFRDLFGHGGTLVDIGANHGGLTMSAARAGRPDLAIVVEANASLIPNLERTVGSLASVEAEVHHVALGETDGGVGTLFVPTHSSGYASVLGGYAGVYGRTEALEVGLRTLDSLLAGRPLPTPVLVKIDVEGADLSVLRGGRSFIEEHRPMLLLELNQTALEAAGESPASLITLLADLGYPAFSETVDPTIRRPIAELDDGRQRNVLVWSEPGPATRTG
jgi:FkbM family methyltransferase